MVMDVPGDVASMPNASPSSNSCNTACPVAGKDRVCCEVNACLPTATATQRAAANLADSSCPSSISCDRQDDTTTFAASPEYPQLDQLDQLDEEDEDADISCRVFVGNLSANINQEELLAFLEENFGRIRDLSIIRSSEPQQKSKSRYGFATFENEEDAVNCIDKKCIDFHGRQVNFGKAFRRPRQNPISSNSSQAPNSPTLEGAMPPKQARPPKRRSRDVSAGGAFYDRYTGQPMYYYAPALPGRTDQPFYNAPLFYVCYGNPGFDQQQQPQALPQQPVKFMGSSVSTNDLVSSASSASPSGYLSPSGKSSASSASFVSSSANYYYPVAPAATLLPATASASRGYQQPLQQQFVAAAPGYHMAYSNPASQRSWYSAASHMPAYVPPFLPAHDQFTDSFAGMNIREASSHSSQSPPPM